MRWGTDELKSDFDGNTKKVILAILLFLAAILLALVILVPLLFNVDRYRPQVASLIEKQTGKPAQIGHLALTFFPTLSIRANDFALSNPSGFPPGYVVKAKRIYAIVDAHALWHHVVIIKSLYLEAPAISLLSDSRGNWNFKNAPTAKPRLPDPPDPPGEKPLFTLGAISDLTITKGQLSVANLPSSGGPAQISFEADNISSELQQVDLSALAEPHAEPQPRAVANGANAIGKLIANGTLNVDSLHVINLYMTSVKSKLRILTLGVFVDNLEFQPYGGRAAGNLAFSFAGQNAHYSADLNLSGVNVGKLLDAFPDARGKMTGMLDGTVKLDGEVIPSPDPLAGVLGSGQLSIRNGQLPTLQLNKNLLQLIQLAKLGPASGNPSSFSSIAADFTISNSRISTSKITIVGNGVQLGASGSLDLAGESRLDFQGLAGVAATHNALTNVLAQLSGGTLSGGTMSFPFILAGTLQNPKFSLKAWSARSRSNDNRGAQSAPQGDTAQQQQPKGRPRGVTGLLKKKKP